MIFDRHVNLKYKYGNRHFWCRGDYVAIIEENKNAIAQYIKNQLEGILQRLKFPTKSIWSRLRAAE